MKIIVMTLLTRHPTNLLNRYMPMMTATIHAA